MDQKRLYDKVSLKTSRLMAESYSTSFSLGIRCLSREMQGPVYAIYGFVRFADEIVDTFQGFDQRSLLMKFKADTMRAITEKISLNPVLHSFQEAVNKHNIDLALIDAFFESMEADLDSADHDYESLQKYVSGSAEAVGLMCLHVFTMHDRAQFEKLKQFAMKLGSAFQKVNFMRDLNTDVNGLGRRYFPELSSGELTAAGKKNIEAEIQSEFDEGYMGIRQLPRTCRLGVYVAYLYYLLLFRKIKRMPPEGVLKRRIRIPNPTKLSLLCYSYVRHQLNMI